jgi:16S rRNA (guanine(527)-N(7))-methyltransferase RsmG
MGDEVEIALADLARKWSFAMTSDISSRVSVYIDLLLEWNRRVNLTGAGSVGEVLGDHLPDSFALSRFTPEGANVVDIGSGGGLPGIPFAILRPDCRITLVEPRAKRVAFLNTATRMCGCKNTTVVRSRLEGYDSSGFSVAVSRATFAPVEWLEIGPGLLVCGGRIVLLTTDEGPTEGKRLRLVDSVQYRTSGNTTRWAGCYCSTWNTPVPQAD